MWDIMIKQRKQRQLYASTFMREKKKYHLMQLPGIPLFPFYLKPFDMQPFRHSCTRAYHGLFINKNEET